MGAQSRGNLCNVIYIQVEVALGQNWQHKGMVYLMIAVAMKGLNILIAICTYLLFRCLLSDRYGNLFSMAIMLCSFDLKDAYLPYLFIKHHCYFLHFVWQHQPYQCKVLTIWAGYSPCRSHITWKTHTMSCHHKFFVLLIIWMIS